MGKGGPEEGSLSDDTDPNCGAGDAILSTAFCEGEAQDGYLSSR